MAANVAVCGLGGGFCDGGAWRVTIGEFMLLLLVRTALPDAEANVSILPCMECNACDGAGGCLAGAMSSEKAGPVAVLLPVKEVLD